MRAMARWIAVALFAYAAIYVAAAIAGFRFMPYGSALAFSSKSGQRYAFFQSNDIGSEELRVYHCAEPVCWFWKLIPSISVGHTYGNYHRGVDLVTSANGTMLFMRRNTESSRGDPIWTDVLDISTDPPTVLLRGPDCCAQVEPGYETSTDGAGLEAHGLKTLDMARRVGAVR